MSRPRRAVVTGLLLAVSGMTGALAAPMPPAALRSPAVQTPRALRAVTLAVARAGSRLVAVGERGTVLWSDDGGRQWHQAQVPVQSTLTAVRFADARVGWAVGHLGVVLRTEDGGQHWTRQLDGIQLAQTLLAAATDEASRHAAERLVQEGADKPFFDLAVLDGQQAVVVGAYGLALVTRDGGAHWAPLPLAAVNPRGLHLYGVQLQGPRWVIVGEQGLVLRSEDGGASFSALASPYKGSFFGLLGSPEGTLLAYGLRGSAFRSDDAGSHWSRVKIDTPVTLQAGLVAQDGSLLLLAQNGELFRSRDQGESFDSLQMPAGPLPAAGLGQAPDGAWILASLRGVRRADPTPPTP
ncbi:YCF48-related protein [Ideonella sp. B508-1]|uniref:YCF48-related protein n=1 Tax=Ideonella sp. B508-1 TaxID=137716 RepID=UPI000475AC5F|nr:YCF48-related protein [Ideonella sp. B508-1]